MKTMTMTKKEMHDAFL